MKGIPGDLYNRLRNELLASGVFASHAALQAMFIDARLVIWRHKLPQEGNKAEEQVNATIAFLYEQYNANHENALILFLEVLRELEGAGTARFHILRSLADELKCVSQHSNSHLEKMTPESAGTRSDYHRELSLETGGIDGAEVQVSGGNIGPGDSRLPDSSKMNIKTGDIKKSKVTVAAGNIGNTSGI